MGLSIGRKSVTGMLATGETDTLAIELETIIDFGTSSVQVVKVAGNRVTFKLSIDGERTRIIVRRVEQVLSFELVSKGKRIHEVEILVCKASQNNVKLDIEAPQCVPVQRRNFIKVP